MDALTRDADFIDCPHCHQQVRRGMIRCRECNGVIADDFELSEDVAANVTALRRCERCQAPLDPGIDDCPHCASQMLDQFLQAPPTEELPASVRRRFSGPPASVEDSRLRPPPSLPPEEPRQARPPRKKKGDSQPARKTGDDDGTEALYESDTDTTARSSRKTVPEFERVPAAAQEPAEPSAGSACQALLLALHTTDPAALCSVVTALGQLGDKAAVMPLERLMGNPEIRVRRAVAEALIALGHPKGESLREIAERKVAAPPPAAARKPARAKGAPTDWGALVKPGLALLVAAVIGGGVWWWQSQPSGSSRSKLAKSKAAKAKKASVKAGKGASAPPAGAAVEAPPGMFGSSPEDKARLQNQQYIERD